jgi:hypothetical protein
MMHRADEWISTDRYREAQIMFTQRIHPALLAALLLLAASTPPAMAEPGTLRIALAPSWVKNTRYPPTFYQEHLAGAFAAMAAEYPRIVRSEFDPSVDVDVLWTVRNYKVVPDVSALQPFSDGADFDAVLLFVFSEKNEALAVLIDTARGYLVDVRTGTVYTAEDQHHMVVRENGIRSAATAVIARLFDQYQSARP